ncbi:MAG: hypothetical protein ABIR32_22090 [Ilumatobacteraceae bacterium]
MDNRIKRHYRPKQDLRRLMVDAGIELLVDDGMHGGENVTIAKVIDRISERGDDPVTKGSVLGKDRLWPSQRAFQLEVQQTFASQIGELGVTRGGTYEAAAAVLDAAELSTAAGRDVAVRELCRVAGRASFDGILASREWRIWLAIWATAMTTNDELEVGSAIRQGEMNSIQVVMESLYMPLAEVFGLRIKPEFGPDGLLMFTLCVAALTDGLAIRMRYTTIPMDDIERPSAPDGSTQTWHLFAIGFEGLLKQFFDFAPIG